MNLSMYSDSEKNLMMMLPDNVSDEQILALCKVASPEEDEVFGVLQKPVAFIDLSDLHASYPLDEIMPMDMATL